MSSVNTESASASSSSIDNDTELEEDDDTELEEELGARPFMFEPEQVTLAQVLMRIVTLTQLLQ